MSRLGLSDSNSLVREVEKVQTGPEGFKWLCLRV